MPQPWYDWVTWNPKTRICANINAERGDVMNFVVAYEYRLRDLWETVAQFDHGPESLYGHDIAEEGLHMDLYKDRNIGLYGLRSPASRSTTPRDTVSNTLNRTTGR